MKDLLLREWFTEELVDGDLPPSELDESLVRVLLLLDLDLLLTLDLSLTTRLSTLSWVFLEVSPEAEARVSSL